MNSKDQVWVTGIGVLSSAGVGKEALREALQEDRFCGQEAALPMSMSYIARIATPLKEEPFFVDDRKSVLALAAAEQAWNDAHLPHSKKLSSRRSFFMGTGLSSITPYELAEDLYPHLSGIHFDRSAMGRDLSPNKAAPWRHQPDRLTHELRKRYGEGAGLEATSFSACAAAAQAIAEGLKVLRRNEADIAVVGGHDSMDHPMGLLSFEVLGALSNSFCRPFDRDRDGFMLGEGAAVLILERAEHAQKRGVDPQAVVLGAGTSIDAWNATAPHPQGRGAFLSMRRALKDAGLCSGQIDYINTHGTGTPLGDLAESKAVSKLFGSDQKCSSVKGAIGHTVAAAGALEAVCSILALQNQFLPGTVGLENQDPDCSVQVVFKSERHKVRRILSNSFGFGGQNCSLILGSSDLAED